MAECPEVYLEICRPIALSIAVSDGDIGTDDLSPSFLAAKSPP
jgi:hypothetical protein